MLTYIHPSITLARILDALDRYKYNLDNPGFCTNCGADAEGIEPDAQQYQCQACETHAVYGAEQLLFLTDRF